MKHYFVGKDPNKVAKVGFCNEEKWIGATVKVELL